jgi:hypothetical protein
MVSRKYNGQASERAQLILVVVACFKELEKKSKIGRQINLLPVFITASLLHCRKPSMPILLSIKPLSGHQ